MVLLGGGQIDETTPQFLDDRWDPFLTHICRNSIWSQARSARFALFYWRCVTDGRKGSRHGRLHVPHVPELAILDAKQLIHFPYPSPFEFADRHIQSEDDTQKNT